MFPLWEGSHGCQRRAHKNLWPWPVPSNLYSVVWGCVYLISRLRGWSNCGVPSAQYVIFTFHASRFTPLIRLRLSFVGASPIWAVCTVGCSVDSLTTTLSVSSMLWVSSPSRL